MRICLKYGIDPNAPGIHPNTINISSNSQTPSSNTYSHSSTRLSPDLPRASPCRNGTLDYNTYYTNERLFTLPPLFLAAQRNNHYACTLLLKYGANVNVRDEQYCSPLHLASRLQHDVCNILISHHACITISNKYGDTPLSLWPNVKQLQMAFVEREFSKLCRKHSSISKRYRFLSRDNNNEQYQTSSSMINTNNYNNGLVPAHGLKNLRRVFRYSGSDSYDSKSFKKSLSSQGSIGKSKRLTGSNIQANGQGTSQGRSESRQVSEERDEIDPPHFRRSFRIKRKVSYRIYSVTIYDLISF
jgi:ankyrin repeat protein